MLFIAFTPIIIKRILSIVISIHNGLHQETLPFCLDGKGPLYCSPVNGCRKETNTCPPEAKFTRLMGFLLYFLTSSPAELNSPIPVHVTSLIPKMLMFTLAISFDHFQFALIHGPGSYALLLFTASDFTSITSHIHNWVLFVLWLRLLILSGVISP